MTNVSSGSKRSWEGTSEPSSHKRPREREDTRDWRDVHLRSPRSKPSSNRKDAIDRRDSLDRRRAEYGGRSRDYDHRRRDYSRDRDRDRDRDRRDDKDRDRDRERSYYRRDEPRRDDHQKVSPKSEVIANGKPVNRTLSKNDSEREEGE